jgi:hypothetical protein
MSAVPPLVYWEALIMQGGRVRKLKVAPRWFQVTEIGDGVFRITEPDVCGRLLGDPGCNQAD